MPERLEEGVPLEPREAPPAPQNLPIEKKKLVIVEASDAIESRARDITEAKMTESKDQLSGIGSWGKRIWKHNLFHEYYRQKEIRKAREQILESGNIYAGETDDKAVHTAAMGAIAERFGQEYDESIHEGEIGPQALRETAEEKAVQSGIQRLVKDYATGTIDENVFEQERNTLFNQLHHARGDVFDKGLQYADNLLAIAKEARTNYDHHKSVDALDLDFEIVIGRAKTGVRTEAQFSAVDRLTKKITKSPVGKFLNEATVASALSIATVVLGRTAQSGGGRIAAWATFGGAAVLSGVVAGARESKKLEEERRQHGREMAQGKTFNLDGSPRRAEMEVFRYETKKATDLAMALEAALYEADGKSPKELDSEQLRLTLEALSDIESRIRLSDQKNIDLLSYSDVTKVEKERLDLDLLRARAKCDLKKAAEKDPALLQGFGGMAEMLNDRTALKVGEQLRGESGFERRNELFKKMKHRKVAAAATKGVLLGLGFGLLAQEGLALAGKSQFGLLSKLFGKSEANVPTTHLTSLEFLRRYFVGGLPRTGPSEFMDGTFNGIAAKLPKGFDVLKNPDGTLALFDGAHQRIVDHLTLNPDGTLSQEAIKMLGDQGVMAHSTVEQIATTKTVTTKEIITEDAASLTEKYKGVTKKIYRTLWYDNDTPKPVFDKNELRLHWGANGIGIDKDGKFVFDMSKMTSDGSYHKEFSVDAQEKMKQGGLKILLSLSRGTQNQVFEVPIGPNGQALIDPNSEVGRTLFQMEGGKAKFLGRFAEVAESVGTKDDVERVRILATYEGKGIDAAPPTTKEVFTTKDVVDVVQQPKHFFDQPKNYVVDPPPVIPIFGRRPLEPAVKRREELEIPYGPYGPGPEAVEFYRERMYPELRKNPQASLDFENVADWYFDREQRTNGEYMQELRELLRQPGMRPMRNECRVSACIPVYDLGEGKVVEHALEQYRKQIENGSVNAKEFEILLFLNHPADKAAEIQKRGGARSRVMRGEPESYDTEEVIRQYMKKHPEVPIRIMKKEFATRPQWGTIIKFAYDVACVRARERRQPKDKDIILLTNDIDVRDMSDTYLRNFIGGFDENIRKSRRGEEARIDGLVGRVDHDSLSYENWPGFFTATRLDQFLDAQNRRGATEISEPYMTGDGYAYVPGERHKGEKHIITQGRNTALRGSIYCGVGGANVKTDAGADTELGKMVSFGRKGILENMLPADEYPFKYRNSAWLETDPRRELGKYKRGESIAWAWSDWAKMDVYGKSFFEQIGGNKEELNPRRLEREFKEILKKWRLGADSPQVIRALSWVGLSGSEPNGIPYKDYEIVTERIDGRDIKTIKIKNIEHLKARIAAWKPKRQRRIRQILA